MAFSRKRLNKRYLRLSRLERERTRALILELTQTIRSLLLDKLSSAHPDYLEIEETLDKLRTHYHHKFLEYLEPLITQNTHHIIGDINKIYQAQGFSVYHPSQVTQHLISSQIEEHLDLIKSIPSDIIQSSKQVLTQSIGSFDAHSIYSQITQVSQASERRAELIARDQTAKAKASYNRALAQDLGFSYYTWMTSRDERVSVGKGGHEYLDKRVYSYQEPSAIIDTYGTKGHPGQRVNCRCVAIPLLYDPDTHELKLTKDSKRGDYYELRPK